MNDLLQLMLAEIGLLLLCCTRLTGLLIVAPLGWEIAPARVRGVLVVVIALGVHSAHPRSLPIEHLATLDWFLLVVGEFVLGAAMGMVVRITIAVAEIAAESFSPIMGLGAAQMFDPQSGGATTVMTRVFKYLAIMLALVMGVHRIVIGGVLGSFRALPLGMMNAPGGAAEPLLGLVADAIASGVRIAVPVLALLFMTQAALAFISRAAPAMQIFSVGFAVTLAVGAIALILTIPDIGRELIVEMSYIGRRIEDVASSMFVRPP
jgi:flagellar biosynthetic protein FliR